jgi:hypothetical protein
VSRASVHRTAAIRSGSSARSENSHGSDVHRPTGTWRRAQSPQSTRPRGVARSSRRWMNVVRPRLRSSSSRLMTDPAISHEGTSRAEPGTSALPPRVGATENPAADMTSPSTLHLNRGVMRTPATTRRLAGVTSGTAPIRPDGRNNMWSPAPLWTSGVNPRRWMAALLAVRNGPIQRSPWAWTSEASTRIGSPSSVVCRSGRAAGGWTRAPARARPRDGLPRGKARSPVSGPRHGRRARQLPAWLVPGDARRRVPFLAGGKGLRVRQR